MRPSRTVVLTTMLGGTKKGSGVAWASSCSRNERFKKGETGQPTIDATQRSFRCNEYYDLFLAQFIATPCQEAGTGVSSCSGF